MASSCFIDMMGSEAAKNIQRPGHLKTHIPANLLADLNKGKYIYVLRNPKDLLVSYFHHQRDAMGVAYHFVDGKFEDFFELFINGPMEYNDCFDHLLAWYPYTKKDNVLPVHYEELKDDPSGQILRIAKFMGDEWHRNLLEEEGLLEKIVELSSFGTMKKEYDSFEIPVVTDPQANVGLLAFADLNRGIITEHGTVKVKDFVRSGKVGGWRKVFTDDMNRRMNEKIVEKLMPVCPEIVDMWRAHGIMD